MHQKVIQIADVTPDELVEKIQSAIGGIIIKATAQTQQTTMITVLNKKDAAKTLNISETFFDKLLARGIVPPTVQAGFNKKGQPIQRWAQHHLIAIKPTIQLLKHCRIEADYIAAKSDIKKILGL